MIGRILSKAWCWLLTADAVAFILLMTAMWAFTYGVTSSLQGMASNQSMYFFWVGGFAILVAFGFRKLKLDGIPASLGILVIGLVGVWILGARLAQPLLDLVKAILIAARQVIPALRSDVPVNTTGLVFAWQAVADASGVLGLRTQAWLASLRQGTPLNDVLMRNLVWTLILWFIVAWMGWFAARRNAIASLLPAITLLAAIISYSEFKIYTLWLMVSILLLLMGIWNYKEHTLQWDKKRVDYSDSIYFDIGQAVIFLTIAIGAITFVTPSVSWREIRDYLRARSQPTRNEVADVLGVQEKSASTKRNASVLPPALPQDHLLTGGFENSQEVVMTISTGELPPIPNVEFANKAPRYYWRSVTYDVYAGTGWITSATSPQKYQPNTPLIQGLLHEYKPLHLEVRLFQPQGRLFWSGMLFSADTPFTANWRVRPRLSLFASQADLLQADMFAAVNDKPSYTVVSYVPLANLDKLRAASTEYPEEIDKRYLGLPASVPARVRQLARDITQGKTNAYDKAKAIEAYLRTYPYTLDVPAPPSDHDVADYFLFEIKKGYCDYYATAMVVLARLNGIPARFVSGYAPGSYDAATAQYVIRERDAHSWAEVYFPEIGWVEFEPTASQAEIVRSLSEPVVSPTPDPQVTQILKRFQLGFVAYWLLPVAVILLLFLLQFTVIERWWYLRLAPELAIQKIYRRLYRLGRPLAGEHTRAETAYEFMQKLISTIETSHTKEHSFFAKIYSSARQDVERLTDLYQNALFSHHPMHKDESRKALKLWKRLRLRLWIVKVNTLLQEKLKAFTSQQNLLS